MSLGQNVNEYFQHRVWASSEAEAREKAKALVCQASGRYKHLRSKFWRPYRANESLFFQALLRIFRKIGSPNGITLTPYNLPPSGAYFFLPFLKKKFK